VKLLLDTCTFLWILLVHRISRDRAAALFSDPAHEVFLSSVSVGELSVKFSLGRLPLPEVPERFLPLQRERHRISSLALEERAVLHLHKLPSLHRDPFDRMLICQAIEHDCVVLTPDPLITQYPVRTIW